MIRLLKEYHLSYTACLCACSGRLLMVVSGMDWP